MTTPIYRSYVTNELIFYFTMYYQASYLVNTQFFPGYVISLLMKK